MEASLTGVLDYRSMGIRKRKCLFPFPKVFLLTAIVVTIFLCSSKEMFGEPPTYLVSRYTLIFCLILKHLFLCLCVFVFQRVLFLGVVSFCFFLFYFLYLF